MVQSSGGCVAPTGTWSPIAAGTEPTPPSIASCTGTEPTCPGVSAPGVILPWKHWDACVYFVYKHICLLDTQYLQIYPRCWYITFNTASTASTSCSSHFFIKALCSTQESAHGMPLKGKQNIYSGSPHVSFAPLLPPRWRRRTGHRPAKAIHRLLSWPHDTYADEAICSP